MPTSFPGFSPTRPTERERERLLSSVKPATTVVFDSFSGNSLVDLIVLFRQKFPLVSVIVVVGLANLSCCCDHCVNVANKKCETKDSSLRINFFLEPRDQRFPGSLSLSLRRAQVGESPGNEVGLMQLWCQPEFQVSV